MKKIIAMLLTLIMCVSVFVACGEEKKPEVKDPVDNPAEPTDKPEDKPEDKPAEPTDKPAEPTIDYSKPGLQADGTVFVGVLDMTDYHTLVIEKLGQSGDARMGITAAEGKVQIGSYNSAATKRNKNFEIDWSLLGLEGHPWEYLGSTVVLDVSDVANVKVIKAPEKKSTFCVKLEELNFSVSGKLGLPDGTELDMEDINWSGFTNKCLINEGGKYVPNWNDKGTKDANSPIFSRPDFNKDWYVICRCDIYDQTAVAPAVKYSLHEFPTAAPAQ